MPIDYRMAASRRTGFRARCGLLAALAASIGLHALAAAIIGVASSGERATPPTTEPDPPRARTLGVAESEAVTITWIGFKEPTPHTGLRANQDQAELSRAAGQRASQVVVRAAETAADAARSASEAVAETAAGIERWSKRVRTKADIARGEREAAAAAERARKASEARRAAEQAAASTAGEPGQTDDREASATALNPALIYSPGRPLARQGLMINTVRPRFDATTRLLELRSLARQPVVAVTFARDGRVLAAEFIVGTATKRREVDEPILNAVFAWRAAGTDLESIPADDPSGGLTVRIGFDF